MKQQSTFVTVLAWIFIIFSGLATCISILQNIMLLTVFPSHLPVPQAGELPWIFLVIFQNIRLYFFAIFFVTLGTFISALGLLKRREWARKAFVFIMGFGIFYMVATGVLQHYIIQSMPAFGTQMADGEKVVILIIQISSVLMIIGFGGLFGWIIKRLMSPEIKAEFQTS